MIDQYRHLPAMLALLMAASPASSQTLSISGRVLPGTCALATPAITLDSVKADALNVGNNNLKTSNLNFTGCIGVTKALLSFDGTAAEGDALRWKNTATSEPAKGPFHCAAGRRERIDTSEEGRQGHSCHSDWRDGQLHAACGLLPALHQWYQRGLGADRDHHHSNLPVVFIQSLHGEELRFQ